MRIGQPGSLSAKTKFLRDIFQNRHRVAAVSSATCPSQEIVMALSRKRLEHFAGAATIGSAFLWADAASASQGPGGGLGTASSFTQLAMAILVYGASALVVGAGLIGAARGR
jgi:hypothetical protein